MGGHHAVGPWPAGFAGPGRQGYAPCAPLGSTPGSGLSRRTGPVCAGRSRTGSARPPRPEARPRGWRPISNPRVSGREHVAHQPQEPVVVDLLRQDLNHDIVIQRPEAVGDVSLDEPGRPGPSVGDLPQRGVTASPWPEPVGPIGERRFVVCLQQQADHLTDEFARPGRQPQRAGLPVPLRDVHPPHRERNGSARGASHR